MTVGIPDDMRRTGIVSLVGHLVLLAVLTAVPVYKMSSPGAGSYQVSLVSPMPRTSAPKAPVAPPPPAPAPPAPIERQHTPPVKAVLPTPPAPTPATVAPPIKQAPAVPALPPVVPKAQERLSDSFKSTLQKVAVPKEVLPASPMEPQEPGAVLKDFQRPIPSESSIKKPSPPVTKAVPIQPPSTPSADVNEMLRRADESLNKPVVVPAAKAAAPAKPAPVAPRMSEDISKLLSALPSPSTAPPASKPVLPPDGKTRQSKDTPPTMVAAAPGSATASRAASLKRCPPKAEKYCPILEAAINRVWNADTNPEVRQVLESAGSATALVRIVIQPNGEIREIRLNTSSGNEPYDRAVQSALREIRTLPPLPEEMKGEPFVAVTSFTYAKKQE